MEKASEQTIHNLIMENRNRLNISGVNEVQSFNEECIVLDTIMGILTVEGEQLHINMLNVQSGELLIEGEITNVLYSDEAASAKGGFFSRMFK